MSSLNELIHTNMHLAFENGRLAERRSILEKVANLRSYDHRNEAFVYVSDLISELEEEDARGTRATEVKN